MGIMQALMGGTYVDKIDLVGGTFASFVSSPTDAEASYRLTSTALEQSGDRGSYTNIGTWIANTANVGLYEVRITVTVGSLTGGDLTGTWLSLGTTRTWSLTRDPVGSSLCTFTVEVRQASTGIVLTSAFVELSAEVF